nr:DUF4390 domain-containing protein [Thioalkalivibrio sp. XN279]
MCLLLLPLAHADEGLVIVDAQTRLQDGVWYLDADIDYQLSATALEALESGLPLDFELDIRLERRRRIIWDAEFAELRQRYQLQFHALTERYITRNLNSGEQSSHASLGAALQALGQVRGLPVIDDALIDPDTKYFVEFRAAVEIKRKGGPLAVVRLFWNDWRTESEWLRWRLGR